MMVYKIELYAYLPKIYFLFYYFELRSELDLDPIFSSAEPDPMKKFSDPHLCFAHSQRVVDPYMNEWTRYEICRISGHCARLDFW